MKEAVGSAGEFELIAQCQHGPAGAGILRSDGYQSTPVAAALGKCESPSDAGIGFGLRGSQDRSCSLNEEGSQVAVTRSGDRAQALLAAGAVLARHKTQPRAELPAAAEIAAVADRGNQGARGSGAHAWQPHQPSGQIVLTGESVDVGVVLGDSLVQAGQLAKQVAHHGVGPTRQVLQVHKSLAAHRSSAQGQDNAELAQEPSDSVDRCGTLLHEALPSAMNTGWLVGRRS